MAGDNGKLWVPIGYQEALARAQPSMGEVSSAVDTLYLRYRIMPYNPDEVVKRKGIAKFHEMRRDDQVRAVLAMKKFSVLAPGWRIDPASEEPLDVEVARFCEHVLDEMPGNITDVLLQVLSALDYGYSVTEIVYELLKRGQWVGKVGLKALKTRKPDFMDFDSDEFGNLKPDGILQKVGSDWRNLPVEKFLVYSYQKEFDNWYGTSDLSACYRAWWSKDCIFKFWNIFLERFGSPTALGKYQSNIPKAEKDALLDVLNDLQARTSITIPEGIEVSLLEATRGGAAGYDRAIEVHNRAITRALLYPDLLGLGERGATGSRALGEVQAAGFLPVLEKIARDVEQTVMVEQLIRRIVDFNFEVERYPQFAINSMTQEDKKAIAEVWIKAAQAGAVSLDEGDENYLRGLLGFPVKGQEPEGGEEMPTKVGPPVAEKAREMQAVGIPFLRAQNRYEERADWKPLAEELTGLEDEAVTSASEIARRMRRKLEETIAKKRVIEDKAIREIDRLQLPYVGDLRTLFRDFLHDAYKLGQKAQTSDIRRFMPRKQQRIQPMPLEPTEALDYFESKSFWMAGVERDHILQGVKGILYQVIKEGRPTRDAIRDIKDFLDPYVATGEIINGRVSSAWRLETVVRTNSIEAYNEGRKAVTRDPDYRDFIVAYEFSAILDARTTDICRWLDGKIFDYDDPDVDKYTPPNHFNCRSTWVPIFWDDTYELIKDADRAKANELLPKGFGGPRGKAAVPQVEQVPVEVPEWGPLQEADLGGMHRKFVVRNNRDGKDYLFKPSFKTEEEFRAWGDVAAGDVVGKAGMRTVPLNWHEAEYQGKSLRGSIQPLLEHSGRTLSVDPADWTKGQLEDVQRFQVTNWLIGNHDGHERQFLVLKNGRLAEVDLGQTMKFFGNDLLAPDYVPNPSPSVYNLMLRAVQDGRITVDREVAIRFAREVQERVPDAFMRDIYFNYAEGRLAAFGELPDGLGGMTKDMGVFLDAIVARKNRLAADFEGLYERLMPSVYEPITEEMAVIIRKAGWQGYSVPIDGTDFEDLQGLFWQELDAVGKPKLMFQAKVRREADVRVMETMGAGLRDMMATVEESSSLDADAFWPEILKAAKSVSYHVAQAKDAIPTKTIKLLDDLEDALTDFIPANVAEAEMKANYLDQVHKIMNAAEDYKFAPMVEQFKARLRTEVVESQTVAKPGKVAVHRIGREEFAQKTSTKGIIRATGAQVDSKTLMGDVYGTVYEFELPGNIKGTYKPHYSPALVPHNNTYSAQGLLQLEVAGDATAQRMQAVISGLQELGLSQKLATAADVEATYLRRMAWCQKLDSEPEWQALQRRISGESANRQTEEMRQHLSERVGTDITQLATYDWRPKRDHLYVPAEGEMGKTPGGRFYWLRYDISDEDIKGSGIRLRHSFSGRAYEVAEAIFENTGALLSTEERWSRLGMFVSGMSSSMDRATGGASYVFFGPAARAIDYGIYVKPTILRRTDWFAHGSDLFGTATHFEHPKFDASIEERLTAERLMDLKMGEVMVKDAIPLLDWIDTWVMAKDDTTSVMNVLEGEGIKRLGGRTLKQVIRGK